MILRNLLSITLFLFSSFSFAQTSNLGRFSVNVLEGCIPLEIEIISENLDSSVNVIQYDFNYNITNNVFNPSNDKSFTYSTAGKYVIAQAINQDGVEKIDLIEIEAYEPIELDVSILNCLNNSIEITINDNYYDGYDFIVDGKIVQSLFSGSNEVNYNNLLDTNNLLEGYIIGSFAGNKANCSKFNLNIAPIDNNVIELIDSIQLENDLRSFNLTYNPEKSTNYEIIIDDNTDTIFMTPSFLYYEHSNINILNKNYNSRCLKVKKYYGCGNTELIEDICLIYLNVQEEENGIKLEFNYNDSFDSLIIFRNDKITKTIRKDENIFTDNINILENKEYCYKIIGYNESKKSISNTYCITSKTNYNPIPIPNAFTPNGDGLNDVFKPLPVVVSDYKMIIFNKYGEKVFESNDVNIGWDGKFKGKITQETYIYKISFIKDDNNINVTGKIILIK